MNSTSRKLVAAMVGVLCGLTATIALAGGFTAKTTIKNLVVQTDKTIVVKGDAGDWANPDLCDSSVKIILPSPTSENAPEAYTEVYAVLLSAHLTGRQMRALLDGCMVLGNLSFPLISLVQIY